MPQIASSFPNTTLELSIPFHDLDPMGVVWHGHYVRYLELARCHLLAQLGYDYDDMQRSGYTWPVIDMHLRYAQPLRYRQRIRIDTTLVEWENRMRMTYRIHDAESGKRITQARTDQVAVHMETGDMQYESPDILIQKVNTWLQAHL